VIPCDGEDNKDDKIKSTASATTPSPPPPSTAMLQPWIQPISDLSLSLLAFFPPSRTQFEFCLFKVEHAAVWTERNGLYNFVILDFNSLG